MVRSLGFGRVGSLALSGLVLLGLAGASSAEAGEWQQPTRASFWSNAAAVSSATVYAPSAPALRAARAGQLNFATSGLHMYCKGQWSVGAVYDNRILTIEQGVDNGVGQSPCLGDGPGAGPDKTGTKVNVAGGQFDVYFQGCQEGVTDTQQDGLPEATCPVAKAEYAAFGRLPAVGAKKATFIQIQSQGMSRQQLSRVIRSLRAVN
ncbi:MAG: hypothetical protein ACKN9D_05345 [Actinomycetales bacterium]